MDYGALFMAIGFGTIFLWFWVIPYLVDYIEDVCIYACRSRKRRQQRKYTPQTINIFEQDSKETDQ